MSTHINTGMGEGGRAPMLQPGEVITGVIRNGIENRRALGKLRPVIVVDASNPGCLIVIGLTSKGTTQSGALRVEMVDKADWGWRGRSFVFGRRLTRLSRIDVGDHVGWISAKDGGTLACMFGFAADWMANDERAVA
jgi:hypothetical protein